MKVLITVKTYPIPSAKYDELVCTAGVREDGSFVRLYPINFRELENDQRYQKYQWIEVAAAKSLSQYCHPERSEGSPLREKEILRCAQNDNQQVFGIGSYCFRMSPRCSGFGGFIR